MVFLDTDWSKYILVHCLKMHLYILYIARIKKYYFEVTLNPPTVTSCQLRSPFPLQLLFGEY